MSRSRDRVWEDTSGACSGILSYTYSMVWCNLISFSRCRRAFGYALSTTAILTPATFSYLCRFGVFRDFELVVVVVPELFVSLFGLDAILFFRNQFLDFALGNLRESYSSDFFSDIRSTSTGISTVILCFLENPGHTSSRLSWLLDVDGLVSCLVASLLPTSEIVQYLFFL